MTTGKLRALELWCHFNKVGEWGVIPSELVVSLSVPTKTELHHLHADSASRHPAPRYLPRIPIAGLVLDFVMDTWMVQCWNK